jgi:Ca2+-binding RTX toxin-like protein
LNVPNISLNNVVTIYNVIDGNGHQVVAVNADGLVITYDPVTTTRIEIFTDGGNDKVTADADVAIPLIVDTGIGNDIVTAGGGNDIVLAGDGKDVANGGPGDDVVVGGPDDDQVSGGPGRDLVIGGTGKDKLNPNGGTGEDILIGGYTLYDDNFVALHAFSSVWGASGVPAVQRAAQIRAGVGPGDAFALRVGSPATVFDDQAEDKLKGSTGVDWFIIKKSGGKEDKVDGDHKGDIFDYIQQGGKATPITAKVPVAH